MKSTAQSQVANRLIGFIVVFWASAAIISLSTLLLSTRGSICKDGSDDKDDAATTQPDAEQDTNTACAKDQRDRSREDSSASDGNVASKEHGADHHARDPKARSRRTKQGEARGDTDEETGEGTVSYVGRCNCNRVKFTVKAPRHPIVQETSGKVRFRFITAHSEDFSIKTVNDEDASRVLKLSELECSNEPSVRHHFCHGCGTHIIHTNVQDPKEFRVNVDCFEPDSIAGRRAGPLEGGDVNLPGKGDSFDVVNEDIDEDWPPESTVRTVVACDRQRQQMHHVESRDASSLGATTATRRLLSPDQPPLGDAGDRERAGESCNRMKGMTSGGTLSDAKEMHGDEYEEGVGGTGTAFAEGRQQGAAGRNVSSMTQSAAAAGAGAAGTSTQRSNRGDGSSDGERYSDALFKLTSLPHVSSITARTNTVDDPACANSWLARGRDMINSRFMTASNGTLDGERDTLRSAPSTRGFGGDQQWDGGREDAASASALSARAGGWPTDRARVAGAARYRAPSDRECFIIGTQPGAESSPAVPASVMSSSGAHCITPGGGVEPSGEERGLVMGSTSMDGGSSSRYNITPLDSFRAMGTNRARDAIGHEAGRGSSVMWKEASSPVYARLGDAPVLAEGADPDYSTEDVSGDSSTCSSQEGCLLDVVRHAPEEESSHGGAVSQA